MKYNVNAFRFLKEVIRTVGTLKDRGYDIRISWDKSIGSGFLDSRELSHVNRRGDIVTRRNNNSGDFDWSISSVMGRSHVVSITPGFDGKKGFITVVLSEDRRL